MRVRFLFAVSLLAVGGLAGSAVGGRSPAAAEQPMAISAGILKTCALTGAGGVRCWGAVSVEGGLREGWEYDVTPVPVQVPKLGSGVQAISGGGDHACALTSAGGVKCWGWFDLGQLGNGHPDANDDCADQYNPCFSEDAVDVSGLSSGVAAIATDGAHSCALSTAGGVECWGSNDHGQLGNGTGGKKDDFSTAPVDVSDLSAGVAALALGNSHTCALTTGGGVKCWGANKHGQLGDGTTAEHHSPVGVAGLAAGVTAVAAGGNHTCALLSGGGVECWGANKSGELGDGTTTDRLTPTGVSGLSKGADQVAAGLSQTCARVGGGAKCWGANDHGQLGDGTKTDRHMPVDVSGLGSGVSSVTAGDSHGCALTDAEILKCWGANDLGQLGDGTTVRHSKPVSVLWGPTCRVPDVENDSITAAKNAIEKRGCAVGRLYRAHSRYFRKGRVIAPDPDYDTFLPKGARIDLLVSKGKGGSGRRARGKTARAPGVRTEFGISADGRRVAFPVTRKHCHWIWIWRVGQKRMTRAKLGCRDKYSRFVGDFALGGTRVLWVAYDFGNNIYCYLLTATVARPKPRSVPFCSSEGDDDYVQWFYGHGSTFAFTTLGEVYAFHKGRLTDVHEGTSSSVDKGRIAVIESDEIGVYRPSGELLGRIPVEASSARLLGSKVYAEVDGAVRRYDLRVQKAGRPRKLQGGPFAYLWDVAGGYAVYILEEEVHLLKLSNGKDVTLAANWAEIEPSGLFYTSKRGVTFLPKRAVRKLFR